MTPIDRCQSLPKIFNFLKHRSTTVIHLTLLSFASWILVIELFSLPALPRTFDGWVHLTTIEQYHHTLAQDFKLPVTWIDNVSNYGMPLGHFTHQVPAYLGALVRAFVPDAQTAFNFSMLIAAAASTILMYLFLKLHFSADKALLAALVFNVAPYRISNIYLRGALPELFTTSAILVLLISINRFIQGPGYNKLLAIIIATGFLALSHPMLFLVAMPFAILYALYLAFELKVRSKIKTLALIAISMVSGTLLAGYYLIPLIFESKYLYIGQTSAQPQTQFEFLHLANFWQEQWKFQSDAGSGVRDSLIQLGTFEFAFIALLFLLLIIGRKTVVQRPLAIFTISTFLLYAFMSLPISRVLYTHLPLLGQIQFPWRMMSILIILPPIAVALITPAKWTKALAVLLILGLYFFRTPQLYGKNFIQYPNSRYEFTVVNLHSTSMNTIWSDASTNYPVKPSKLEIIDGDVTILSELVLPTVRKYSVIAKTPARMIDNTFYYPGWQVLIDGVGTEIEYQDIEYRGMITYRLTPGDHQITVVYKPTRVRQLGNALTLLTAAGILGTGLIAHKFKPNALSFIN